MAKSLTDEQILDHYRKQDRKYGTNVTAMIVSARLLERPEQRKIHEDIALKQRASQREYYVAMAMWWTVTIAGGSILLYFIYGALSVTFGWEVPFWKR